MKIAIITGASSGMGREFVRQLDALGGFDAFYVIARRRERLEALAQECRTPVHALPMDLQHEEGLQEYEAFLKRESPEVALLVNCAGFGKFGRCDEIPLSDQLGMIDLNARALTAVTTLTLPYLSRGSAIVQLDSLSAFQPVPYLTVYAATKAYVLSYSRALGAELKPQGIRVMAVSPGWVKTEFFDRAAKPGDTAVTYFNHIYTPEAVVKKAIHDLYHTKKDVSILGARIRAQVRTVKLLPHKLVMKIWLHQQGHD